MGRVGRQRKFKSVDPFTKRSVDKKDDNERFNLDPKEENENDDTVPRKAKQIMKLSKIGTTMLHRVSRKKKKKSSELSKKPGESTKQFFNRLDERVDSALHKALIETKKLRGKRKDHLRKRDEKRKSKKSKSGYFEGNDIEKTEKTDEVKFGEVVSQPPSLSAVPRKGQAKKASLDLKLINLIKKDSNEDPIDKVYKIKRKEMTEKMKKIHDEEREKAIKEYRKMKQRKSIKT